MDFRFFLPLPSPPLGCVDHFIVLLDLSSSACSWNSSLFRGLKHEQMANDAAAPSTLQYVRTVLAPQYRVTPMANAAVDGAGPAEDDVKFFFDFEQLRTPPPHERHSCTHTFARCRRVSFTFV